ncbi:MAG: low molecular weight protein-tyrosine-phosphatase [Bacteroidales bacterium]
MSDCALPSKYKILFVCLGNICRSPAAEGIMKHQVEAAGLSDKIEVDSAGTYGGHAGEAPDSRMRITAKRHGYTLEGKARQVAQRDFDSSDIILAMDDRTYDKLRDMAYTLEEQNKVHRMIEYSVDMRVNHVPDPYYGGIEGFNLVVEILEDACQGLLKSVEKELK